jgi:hypothetical protein
MAGSGGVSGTTPRFADETRSIITARLPEPEVECVCRIGLGPCLFHFSALPDDERRRVRARLGIACGDWR